MSPIAGGTANEEEVGEVRRGDAEVYVRELDGCNGQLLDEFAAGHHGVNHMGPFLLHRSGVATGDFAKAIISMSDGCFPACARTSEAKRQR